MRLLAEGHPQELMKQYEHNSLEDIFLDLCRGVKKTTEQPQHESAFYLQSVSHDTVNIANEDKVSLLRTPRQRRTVSWWKRYPGEEAQQVA